VFEVVGAVELRLSLGGNFDLFGRLGVRFGLADAQIGLPDGFSGGEGLKVEGVEPVLVVGLGWRII